MRSGHLDVCRQAFALLRTLDEPFLLPPLSYAPVPRATRTPTSTLSRHLPILAPAPITVAPITPGEVRCNLCRARWRHRKCVEARVFNGEYFASHRSVPTALISDLTDVTANLRQRLCIIPYSSYPCSSRGGGLRFAAVPFLWVVIRTENKGT